MINYDVFYKRNVVRLPQHLMLPYMPTIDKFEFPFRSVHHYVAWDSVLDGPESSEYFYRNIDKKIFVEHVFELVGDKGKPRRAPIPLLPIARQWHMKNKRFRYAENAAETVTDRMTLVVVNYGIIAKAYRYTRSLYADYYKWANIQTTLWSKVGKIAANTDNNQFVFVELPTKLMGMSVLDQHASRFSERTVRNFGGPNGWFILEMWKWLSEEYRNNSVIGDLPQEALNKINLVINESGRFVVINLGVLNSWRFIKTSGNNLVPATEAFDDPAFEDFFKLIDLDPISLTSRLAMESIEQMVSNQRAKISPRELQKRFLKLLMTMIGLRGAATVEIDDAGQPTGADDTGVAAAHAPVHQIEPTQEDEEKTATQIAEDILKNLDQDIAALDEMSDDSDEEDVEDKSSNPSTAEPRLIGGEYSIQDFDQDTKPEDVIRDIVDDLADSGMMPAGDYRRFLRLSENYKQITAPNSNQTLAEFATVKPEDLAITKPFEFADIKTVSDKTMLSNTLMEFDEKYVKNILNKDIASMIVNAQKGGFIINRYDVERMENIAGKFDTHTVRITPVEGLPSTLRFTIPVVEEDGVYTSGGVRYIPRKQRGDKPLRKTDPDRVAMTTYFGKTFVSRNDKRVNDYGEWLRGRIMEKGMDPTDQDITHLSPANVFDNTFDAARTYTSVAQRFKSFDARGYHFDFNRNSELFEDYVKKSFNKNGMVVVAKNDAGEHLVVDKNNVIYAVTKDGLDPRGTFESFLGINTKDAPVDFAQVKIYGKNLPVGIVLSYMYGLEKLLEMLKVHPRRVPVGQRLHLQDNEFAITFSDETLVFSRDDQLASLVFGGFRDFERTIKQYSVHTFDRKNVYLNVLESQGIGVRFLREIDMFNNLFVDPISKDLLQKDGLPTTFPGMLIKATEYLKTDTHPDTLDMAYMRIKGYERFAGAVYSEICQAIREHKSRSGRSHQQIDMNPHSVWLKIAQDRSVITSSGINPIKNIKEREAVTYNGVGGRTSRSMVRSTRAYHRNDMGVISESTVDNSDVGINTFMSANPQFDSLRGTTLPYDVNNPNPTSLLSTGAQLSVGSTHDDLICM